VGLGAQIIERLPEYSSTGSGGMGGGRLDRRGVGSEIDLDDTRVGRYLGRESLGDLLAVVEGP
jgi:hypothetical protein